jgi:2-polyprenyl-6-methoxyphenol hydroxylase-like FAD-dependent oxidoreductase
MPSTNGVMRMTFGLHGFFSYQVLEGGEVYWFNNLFEPVEPAQRDLDAVPDEQWQHTLLDVHRSDHTPINEIIRATEHRIVRYGVYEMPVLPTWHKDRVCLVGDAAHAMGPHTGQGAAMALEDAVVLAKCLRDIDDVERAFAAYQRIRKQRVDFVVRQTRRTGNTKKPPGAWGRWMRDLVLPVFLKHGVNTFTPIYNHRIGWNEPVA